MTSRLILIEGMIGAGKSTTAATLATRLADRGTAARAYLESADDHPIRTRAVDLLRGAGEARDPAVYALDQWAALAGRCQSGQETIILEGAFLQNSVMPAFIEDAPIEDVRTAFARIEAYIAPLRPLLVYLRPSDTARAVQQVHRARGDPWSSSNLAFVSDSPWARRRSVRGQAAVIALYRAWEPVVDELLALYSSPTLLLIDPQDDWEGALQRIVDCP